jgi:general secretion pathway protein F
MPAFRFVAIDSSGKPIHGTVEAASEAAVIEDLQRQGHVPMRAELARRGQFLDRLLATEFNRSTGLRRQDVASTTRELAIMLSAGQDLDRALRFVVETAPNPRIKTVIGRIRDKVRNGSALADALAGEGASFPRLYVGLVRAGEAGGSLGEALERLASLLERERAMSARIQSALLYPVLLIVAAVGSIALLLTTVLPQFVPMFKQSGVAMPRSTQLLIDLGALTASAGPWLLIALFVGALALRQALKDPVFRLPFDRLVLRVPIAGRLVREALAARFTRTLGTLLSNGVPLIASLGIVKESLGNLAAVRAVDNAIGRAKDGAGLSQPLSEAGIFPIRTIHLLRLGEDSAQLAQTAMRAAAIHEEETRLGIERLVSMMVPLITIAMGAAVAGIVGSLMMAMLSLNDLAN